MLPNEFLSTFIYIDKTLIDYIPQEKQRCLFSTYVG